MQKLTSFLYYTGYCEVTIEATWFTVVSIIPMPTPAASPARQQFDYSSLDSATSDFVQQQTGEIRALMKRTAQSIVTIGLKLIEVKEELGHGRFGDWLEAEFAWSYETAARFMRVYTQFKSVNLTDLSIAPSALYVLAAPSTPEPVREEALARAEAGEPITHKAALAIKHKYTTPLPTPQPEPELEKVSVVKPTPAATPSTQPSSKKPEIVAFRSKGQTTESAETSTIAVSTPAKVTLASAPNNLSGTWWQLGKHLLYCGDPNSPDFLSRVTGVRLLLAFPPDQYWIPKLPATVRLIRSDFLLLLQPPTQLEPTIEAEILLHSPIRDMVVSCFLPTPDILLTINRLGRWAVVAEPDPKRYNPVIADWKKAGMKVERVS